MWSSSTTRPSLGLARNGLAAEYHQEKWHVAYDGRFGFEEFVDPAFIGATTVSLLEVGDSGGRFFFRKFDTLHVRRRVVPQPGSERLPCWIVIVNDAVRAGRYTVPARRSRSAGAVSSLVEPR